MTDIWTDEQARRLFPIIALGGTAGAVIGPIITRSLIVSHWYGLVIDGICDITYCCRCVRSITWKLAIAIWENRSSGQRSCIRWGHIRWPETTFWQFIFNNVFDDASDDAIGTIAYVLVTDYSGTAFPHNAVAQTRFAANMDLSTNIIQIILQLTVTRWLLVRYGAGVVFRICRHY